MPRFPIERAQALIEADAIPFGPRTNPCVCGCGHHTHSGSTNGGKCTGKCGKNCARYRVDLAYKLAAASLDTAHTSLGTSLRLADQLEREQHYQDNPRKPGEWSLGASDAGGCPRAIWYKNMPPESLVRAPTDYREARIGALIHKEATNKLKMLYPWQEFDRPITIHGLDRDSEADRYDEVIGEVEDLKTAGDWRWDDMHANGVSLDVWKQVALYGLGLIEEGKSVKTLKITYLKRCNGHDEPFTRLFDLEFAEAARQELLAIATGLDLAAGEAEDWDPEQHDGEEYDPGDLLPRTRSGPGLDKLCDRCTFRIHCWKMDEAEELGRSPQSLVELGREPDDPTVVFVIEDNIKAKALAAEAEDLKKSTGLLVEGLTPGRYGPGGLLTIAEQPFGGGPNHKAHAAALAANALLPFDQQRDPATIPVPKYGKVIHSIAKPTSKATLEKDHKAAGKRTLKVGEDVA
jgi:hypothetical protein